MYFGCRLLVSLIGLVYLCFFCVRHFCCADFCICFCILSICIFVEVIGMEKVV